jgi:hypothetical protein
MQLRDGEIVFPEACRIAVNIAKLPELVRKGLGICPRPAMSFNATSRCTPDTLLPGPLDRSQRHRRRC